jgi:hypothetical protein
MAEDAHFRGRRIAILQDKNAIARQAAHARGQSAPATVGQ